MGQPEKHEPPKARAKDHAHMLARAGIGSIPIVGAAVTELLQMIIMPSLEKRKVIWMNDVAEELRALEEKKHLRLEDLAENEVFIDTVLKASNTQCEPARKKSGKHFAVPS